MADLKYLSNKAIGLIKEKADEGFVSVSQSEKREFNLEGGEFTLYRTLFNEDVTVQVYKEKKKGVYATNKLTESDIVSAVNSAVEAAESGETDDANVLAENQGFIESEQGVYEPDEDKLFARTVELKETIEKDYPKIQIVSIIVVHNKLDSLYMNTNGTECKLRRGNYSVTLEISGHDGEKTTGLAYTGASFKELDKPFIEISDFKTIIETAIKQLDAEPISEKFTGTMVCTPSILENFVYTIADLTGGTNVLEKTSVWIDKLNQKVADERVNFRFVTKDDRMVTYSPLCDGYKSEPFDFIKDGVVKNFCISDYIARKTGFERAKNNQGSLVIEAGEKSLDEIISGIKKGILVGEFSGGQPGPNGDFSGVAKNSFLIEDGKISKPLSETMINGNLFDALNNLVDISKEVRLDGGSVIPYMAFDGIVVSGK